jgi:hypothetical protein
MPSDMARQLRGRVEPYLDAPGRPSWRPACQLSARRAAWGEPSSIGNSSATKAADRVGGNLDTACAQPGLVSRVKDSWLPVPHELMAATGARIGPDAC